MGPQQEGCDSMDRREIAGHKHRATLNGVRMAGRAGPEMDQRFKGAIRRPTSRLSSMGQPDRDRPERTVACLLGSLTGWSHPFRKVTQTQMAG